MVSLKGYRAQLLRGVREKAHRLSCEVLGSVCKVETDSFISLFPPPPTALPPPPTMNLCLPLSLARHSQGRPCAQCGEGEQSQRCTPHTSPPPGAPPLPTMCLWLSSMYLRASRPRGWWVGWGSKKYTELIRNEVQDVGPDSFPNRFAKPQQVSGRRKALFGGQGRADALLPPGGI